MTKRIIALLLALIMIFSLAACSDSDDKDDDKDEKVEKKEEKDEDEKADIDPGDEGDETKNDEENKEDAPKDDYEARYLAATFENGISVDKIYDKNDITITPVSYTVLEDPIQNNIELRITNNGSLGAYFRVREVYVNGIRFYASGDATNAPVGESSSIIAYFDPAMLRALDLSYIKELKVNLSYTTAADPETDIFVETESILFERPENYTDSYHKSSQTLLDRNDIYCASNYLGFEYSGCYRAYLYVENNNDFNVSLQVDSVTANGEQIDFTNYGDFALAAHSKNLFPVEVNSSTLLNDISSSVEFEMTFTAYNAETSNSAEAVLFHGENDGTFTADTHGKIN